MINRLIKSIFIVFLLITVYFSSEGCQKQVDQATLDSINVYTELIKKYPADPVYYKNRGDAYFKIERYNESVADYQRALQIDPFDLPALRNLAAMYVKMEKYSEAIKEYDNLIRLYPTAQDYINRGNVHESFHNIPMAVADYTRAVDMDTNNVYFYFVRGNAHDKAGNYQLSIADYTSIISRQPNNIGARLNRGNAYYNSGNYKGAVEDWNIVIQQDPSYEGDLSEKMQIAKIRSGQ
jgi:tetratricopeptide (TPR) repeat protein